MDFLSAINFEQLGTAGVFVAYLLYALHRKDQVIDRERQERKDWQEKAFDVSRASQQEVADAVKTLDRALDLLKN